MDLTFVVVSGVMTVGSDQGRIRAAGGSVGMAAVFRMLMRIAVTDWANFFWKNCGGCLRIRISGSIPRKDMPRARAKSTSGDSGPEAHQSQVGRGCARADFLLAGVLAPGGAERVLAPREASAIREHFCRGSGAG